MIFLNVYIKAYTFFFMMFAHVDCPVDLKRRDIKRVLQNRAFIKRVCVSQIKVHMYMKSKNEKSERQDMQTMNMYANSSIIIV